MTTAEACFDCLWPLNYLLFFSAYTLSFFGLEVLQYKDDLPIVQILLFQGSFTVLILVCLYLFYQPIRAPIKRAIRLTLGVSIPPDHYQPTDTDNDDTLSGDLQQSLSLPSHTGLLILTSVIFESIAEICRVFALKNISSGNLMLIMELISTAIGLGYASLVGGRIKETMNAFSIVGVIFIFGSLFLMIYPKWFLNRILSNKHQNNNGSSNISNGLLSAFVIVTDDDDNHSDDSSDTTTTINSHLEQMLILSAIMISVCYFLSDIVLIYLNNKLNDLVVSPLMNMNISLDLLIARQIQSMIVYLAIWLIVWLYYDWSHVWCSLYQLSTISIVILITLPIIQVFLILTLTNITVISIQSNADINARRYSSLIIIFVLCTLSMVMCYIVDSYILSMDDNMYHWLFYIGLSLIILSLLLVNINVLSDYFIHCHHYWLVSNIVLVSNSFNSNYYYYHFNRLPSEEVYRYIAISDDDPTK